MKLKKLTPQLVEGIIEAGFDKEPHEIQSLSIPKIKSGADMFILSPEGSGKTTALVIGIIQQLKEEFEEAPRAIVMVPTKEKAFEMEEQFKLLGKKTNLRTFVVFDKGIIQYQKDIIYEGLDILIGTPKRLNELVGITGIPLTKVKIFAVDDAETISTSHYASIYRISDNIEKSQFIISANKWTENFNRLKVRMLKSPLTIKA